MSEAKPEASILALNSGSSSLKFGLYRVDAAQTAMLIAGEAEEIGSGQSRFHAQDSSGNALLTERNTIASHRDAVVRISRLLSHFKMPEPVSIGHRVVHGGPALRRHCLIDDTVLTELETAIPFAPLHTPSALSVIRFAREHFPDLPEVACFDTAFHAQLPDVARILPLPNTLLSEGIQRYGFHGLSCESIVRQLGADIPERLIIAHLGNGASITAVKNGVSVDTSMGLTPTGGVIMGTRSGDLDPGVVLYLMRQKKLDAARLEDMLDRRSGLIGISGISSDMRILHERASMSSDARLAIEMFCYSVRKQIAAMIAALNGVETVVFSGGIGENDAAVRAAICAGLSWAGIGVDPDRNRSGQSLLNDPDSRCAVRIVRSEEDEQIARHSWGFLTEYPLV